MRRCSGTPSLRASRRFNVRACVFAWARLTFCVALSCALVGCNKNEGNRRGRGEVAVRQTEQWVDFLFLWALQSTDQRFPSSLEDLRLSDPRAYKRLTHAGMLTDPWGRPFLYEALPPYLSCGVWSFGADGSPGGYGDDADIVRRSPADFVMMRRGSAELRVSPGINASGEFPPVEAR